jgi:cyclopropane-fatty-acyl-phospholipid synthase
VKRICHGSPPAQARNTTRGLAGSRLRRLPGGKRIGRRSPPCAWSSRLVGLATFAAGQIGKVAEDFVEQRVRIEGRMRDVMAARPRLLPGSPVPATPAGGRSAAPREVARPHTPQKDAEQIRFHYDVSDDFYALWLDPRAVYSCAYFREPTYSLAQAQEAKLDHICRKLMLQPGERFLDIGAGWGGLLLWAAEHYGVQATGITLSHNQHAYVNG